MENEKEIVLKRILPGDLKSVKSLREPLKHVFNLFTANGEPEWVGRLRGLFALGIVNEMPGPLLGEDFNPTFGDSFNKVAVEVRQHFVNDKGEKDPFCVVSKTIYDHVDEHIGMLKRELRTVQETTNLIMIVLGETPTDNLTDDLDVIGEKVHDLVKARQADPPPTNFPPAEVASGAVQTPVTPANEASVDAPVGTVGDSTTMQSTSEPHNQEQASVAGSSLDGPAES